MPAKGQKVGPMPQERRDRIAATMREIAPTRKRRWDIQFWEAIDSGDMDAAAMVLAEAIRRRLEAA